MPDNNLDNELFKAVTENNLDAINDLLSRGADIDAQDDYILETPLHMAVKDKKRESVKLLLEKGAKVDARDEHGYTPLHLAATFGYTEMAAILLEKEADIEARTIERNETPLCLAAEEDNVEVAEVLLKNGANVNAKNHINQTPTHIAAKNASLRMAKLLIDYKADINTNTKDADMETPIVAAFKSGNLELAGALIENGADIFSMADKNNRIKVVDIGMFMERMSNLHRAIAAFNMSSEDMGELENEGIVFPIKNINDLKDCVSQKANAPLSKDEAIAVLRALMKNPNVIYMRKEAKEFVEAANKMVPEHSIEIAAEKALNSFSSPEIKGANRIEGLGSRSR